MGRTHAVAGAKISDDDIQKCKMLEDYRKGSQEKLGIRTMGIDVGGVNHVWVDEWTISQNIVPGLTLNDQATPKMIFETTTSGKADDFGELDVIFKELRIDGAVIDAEPERRESYKFATRFWGRVMLLDWLWSQQGRQVITGPEEECTLKANRTSWLDLSQGRFRNRTIRLPRDMSVEAQSHIREPQRIYKKDKYGNPVGYYESVKADHFAFARVFSELALGLALSVATNQNVTDFY
jgi:hypothetical protein